MTTGATFIKVNELSPRESRLRNWRETHVSDVYSLTLISPGRSIVGEGVGGRGRGIEAWARARATSHWGGSKASTTAAEAETATTAKSTTAEAAGTAAEAATHTAAITTTAAEVHTCARTSVAVLANLNSAALPVVAVELLDSATGIVGALENNDARTLGAAVGTAVDIGADDTANASCESRHVSVQHNV